MFYTALVNSVFDLDIFIPFTISSLDILICSKNSPCKTHNRAQVRYGSCVGGR